MRAIQFKAKVIEPKNGVSLATSAPVGTWVFGDLHFFHRVPHIHHNGGAGRPLTSRPSVSTRGCTTRKGATSTRATSCDGTKTRSCTWLYSAAACSTPALSRATLASMAVSRCGSCARRISTAPSSGIGLTIKNY